MDMHVGTVPYQYLPYFVHHALNLPLTTLNHRKMNLPMMRSQLTYRCIRIVRLRYYVNHEATTARLRYHQFQGNEITEYGEHSEARSSQEQVITDENFSMPSFPILNFPVGRTSLI